MNKEPQLSQKSERLFWPRSSEAAMELAEVLKRLPERPLSQAQKAEVLAFEKDIF